AGGRELDLGVGLRVRVPPGERAHVVGRAVGTVLGAQQVLGQDLQRVRQTVEAVDGGQSEDLVRVPADVQGSLCTERVNAAPGGSSLSCGLVRAPATDQR